MFIIIIITIIINKYIIVIFANKYFINILIYYKY
jgi:hypothetical protein